MDISKNAGHVVMDMRADKVYTRHSEGAFLRMNDGRILYAYSRFTGNSNDAAPCDIVGRWSADEGETWSDAEILLRAADYGTHNIMSVSLLRMANGDVGLFFGSRQSGLPVFRVADPGLELPLLQQAQQAAADWIDRCGTAQTPEAAALRQRVGTLFARTEGTMN